MFGTVGYGLTQPDAFGFYKGGTTKVKYVIITANLKFCSFNKYIR
jgi:hypothetical protein